MSKSPNKRKEFDISDNLGVIIEEAEFNTMSPKDEVESVRLQGGLGMIDFACFDPKKQS